MSRFAIVTLLLAAVAGTAASQVAAADSELPCNKVPGPLVASTLGGRLLDTRNPGWLDKGESRCNYRLVFPPDTTSQTFVLWTYPDSEYDGLREVATGFKDVAGVGDAAHTYVDPDTKRHWLTAVKRGRITISATGPAFSRVKQLALLALSRYN